MDADKLCISIHCKHQESFTKKVKCKKGVKVSFRWKYRY
jgi:hypothetical protein